MGQEGDSQNSYTKEYTVVIPVQRYPELVWSRSLDCRAPHCGDLGRACIDLGADHKLRLDGPVLRPTTARISGQRASPTSWRDARAVRNLRTMHRAFVSPDQEQRSVGLAG